MPFLHQHRVFVEDGWGSSSWCYLLPDNARAKVAEQVARLKQAGYKFDENSSPDRWVGLNDNNETVVVRYSMQPFDDNARFYADLTIYT